MSLLGKVNSSDLNKMIAGKIPEVEIKITVIGESNVGKTSLSQRIAYDKFTVDTETTIGAAFCQFRHTQNGVLYSFKLWDTAGQERFNALVPMYLNGSHIVLMVFDITNIESFEKIKERWYGKVQERASNAVIILIGNKADLKANRQVSYYSAEGFAKENGISYLECSAKNSENIDEIAKFFLNTAGNIRKEKLGDTITLTTDEQTKAGCLQCYIF